MNDIKKKINDINIPFEYNPSSEDYVRGHCLYKLEGYIQPKYVIYNEELSAFNKSSNIYKYGINILQKFNYYDFLRNDMSHHDPFKGLAVTGRQEI